jgi:hypothetical protein
MLHNCRLFLHNRIVEHTNIPYDAYYNLLIIKTGSDWFPLKALLGIHLADLK